MIHTKGEWQYGAVTHQIYAEESNGLRTNICTISREDAPDKECQANARLITAAPNLLAASEDGLKELLRFVLRLDTGEADNTISKMKAAIERATKG